MFFTLNTYQATYISHILWYDCTVVNKGMKIGILDFELGAFSETLEHL